MFPKIKTKHVVTVAGVLLLSFPLIFTTAPQKTASESVPQGTHRTQTIIPSGLQVYKVSQAAELWPKILEATIDPPDVHVGDTQKLSVTLEDSQAISVIEAHIETDNGATSVPLYETARDNSKITYANQWVVKDTHNTTYHTTFFAKDVSGRENSVTIAWTDACGIPINGAWSSSANCTISSSDGVENGNITRTGGTLTLNADLAWNPGYSLIISSGSIVIATGQSLKQTYIWQIDTDNDNYPGSLANILQDTAPTNGKRRSALEATQIADCDDTSNIAQITYNSWYDDQDGDGYTFQEMQGVCASYATGISVGCPNSSYAKKADGSCVAIDPRNGPDCYDTNANVNPGQTAYFTTDRGDGSYDYNCNGTQDQQYLTSTLVCGSFPTCNTASGVGGYQGGTPACGSPAGPALDFEVDNGCYNAGGFCARALTTHKAQSCR